MEILFIKLGAIGDAVMALSLVPAIEQTHPGARLTWMCGRAIEPLLRLFPQIHALLVVDERVLFGPEKMPALGELLRLQGKLLGRRFDLVLHGNMDWRYRLLTASVRAGETRGWSRRGSRPWPIPGRYHGDEYARLITQQESPLRGHWAPPVPHFAVPAAWRERLAGEGPLIVLAPGGARNLLADSSLRRWPLERYVELAESLVRRGCRLALTGGETDRWVQPAFKAIPRLDLIGATSLPDLLAVYSCARAVVSHDTSSVHLPRLVGAPVVALFGPTTPTQFFPSTPGSQVIWGGEHLACRPCYDGRHYSPCPKNLCMHSISVSRVLAAVEAAMASPPAVSGSAGSGDTAENSSRLPGGGTPSATVPSAVGSPAARRMEASFRP